MSSHPILMKRIADVLQQQNTALSPRHIIKYYSNTFRSAINFGITFTWHLQMKFAICVVISGAAIKKNEADAIHFQVVRKLKRMYANCS